MTKTTYFYRQQAVSAAAKLDYVGFRTWPQDDMWRLSYHGRSSPAQEWLAAQPPARREFVHHAECFYNDKGVLVPVLVVNVTKEELEDEGEVSEVGGQVCLRTPDGQWFAVEPFAAEAWETDEERTVRKAQANVEPPEADNSSTAVNPTRLVHEIADSMPDAPRKDVVAACLARGVNKNTASTQYYQWQRKRKEAAT